MKEIELFFLSINAPASSPPLMTEYYSSVCEQFESGGINNTLSTRVEIIGRMLPKNVRKLKK
jgi:hypothetical protein